MGNSNKGKFGCVLLIEIGIGEFGVSIETFSDSRQTLLAQETFKLVWIVPEITWASLNSSNIKRKWLYPWKTQGPTWTLNLGNLFIN